MRNSFPGIAGVLMVSFCLLAGHAIAEVGEAEVAAAKTTLIKSVAIPTVAGRGRVPQLAEYYSGILEQAGFAA
ncbi:MAG TPA: hypothetical protein VKN35_08405, partial [Xanthomonadales bacterium]|nr:hypothetical protein [Xanthomonadales bacterium]